MYRRKVFPTTEPERGAPDEPDQSETPRIGRRGVLRYGAMGGALDLAGPVVPLWVAESPAASKDNINTSDQMTTTAGSFALAGSIARRDSFVQPRNVVAHRRSDGRV